MRRLLLAPAAWLAGLALLVAVQAAAAACPPAQTTPVHALKGYLPGAVTQGRPVTVDGTVSGVFLGKERLNGFYLQQDREGDLPAGIFVYAPRLDAGQRRHLQAGARLRVVAQLDRFRGQWQLTRVASLTPCGEGPLPAPVAVTLPLADEEQWARLEGLHVTFLQPLTVSGHYQLARFGTLTLSADGRLFRPTNDPRGNARDNVRRRIVLDDGSYAANPHPVPYLNQEGTRRAGSTVTGLTGVLAHAFDDYRIHPLQAPVFQDAPRPPAPAAPATGALRVAVFNVENYFLTLGRRGAADRAALERQRAKLVPALLGLGADVIGLVEVENDPRALRDLVAQLNRAAPRGVRYAALDAAGHTGRDAITVALIYRIDRVRPSGEISSDADPVHERPPLAATFRPLTGDLPPFTVVAVHFKSKTGCPEQGDVDRGQGCWNERRVAQARALAGFTATLRDRNRHLLVLGDLNSYGAEDPLAVLRAAKLHDLLAEHLPPERRYTYVFRAEAGYLDHVLASPVLAERVSRVGIWHINADEPRLLAYDGPHARLITPTPYRSSDHDPVFVDLR